jgi:hypothetical protein
MKKLYSFFAGAFLLANAAFAQIPNPGMETWVSGSPTGWVGYNDVPTSFYTCVQSADAHTGTKAAKLQVAGVNFIGGRMQSMFAQNSFPLALTGYIKSTLDTSYALRVRVHLYNNGGANMYKDTLFLQGPTNGYQQFVFTLDTSLAATMQPDSAAIFFGITNMLGAQSLLNLGGNVLIDDLAWAPIPTGIKTPAEDNTPFLTIYPNPVRDVLTVESRGYLNKGGFIKITSVTGQTVLESRQGSLSKGLSKVDLNVSDLPAGSYFVTITADGSSTTRPFRKFE